jgi:phage-related protein
MTGEEMERAIEFLLQSQASFEVRMVAFEEQQRRTDAQVAEAGRQLTAYAETQSEFIGIVTESFKNVTESIKNLTENVKNVTEDVKNLTENVKNLAEGQAHTERTVGETNARLDRLAMIVEQHIIAGH